MVESLVFASGAKPAGFVCSSFASVAVNVVLQGFHVSGGKFLRGWNLTAHAYAAEDFVKRRNSGPSLDWWRAECDNCRRGKGAAIF